MFGEELNRKIEQQEQELILKEEEYVNAVRSHKDYNTLKGLRDNINELKKTLQDLYSQKVE
jgi:hypothetical protein